LKILSHVQSLTGVGHFVRGLEIARTLGARHDVRLVDGGWPVPRASAPDGVTFVEIPRVYRVDGQLVALDGSPNLGEVLRERAARLVALARALRPDVVVIEHFPFSKWEIEGEFRALIDAARAAHAGVKVVCSVRDVTRKTRFDGEPAGAPPYAERVRAALAAFDAVLVHSDPRFLRIEEQGALPARLSYTGFVSRKLSPGAASRRALEDAFGSRRPVLASAGGSRRGLDLLRMVMTAWQHVAGAPALLGRQLVVFAPARAGEPDVEALRGLADGTSIRVERFDPDFLEWLAVAELSVSRAGYNTCANLLEIGRRAVLIPDLSMSDQPVRARRFAALGLAEVLEDPSPEACAEGILRALARPEPRHDLALDGAEQTRRLIEALCEGEGSSWSGLAAARSRCATVDVTMGTKGNRGGRDGARDH